MISIRILAAQPGTDARFRAAHEGRNAMRIRSIDAMPRASAADDTPSSDDKPRRHATDYAVRYRVSRAEP